jgi:hypothetical protein
MSSCSVACELCQQGLLIVGAQRLVGHGEKAVVFLLDMLTQQSDERAGVRDESVKGCRIAGRGGVDGVRHAAHGGTAQFVLVEHDGGWPEFTEKRVTPSS